MTDIFDRTRKFQPGDPVILTKDLKSLGGAVYVKGSKMRIDKVTPSGSGHSLYDLMNDKEVVLTGVSDEWLVSADSPDKYTRISEDKLDEMIKIIRNKHHDLEYWQNNLRRIETLISIIENPKENSKIEIGNYSPLDSGPITVNLAIKDDPEINDFKYATLKLLKKKAQILEHDISEAQEYFGKFVMEFTE